MSLTSGNLNPQWHNYDNENRGRLPDCCGKAHIQILPMTLNPMWPRTGNLISQFLFLNLWDEIPSRSNLVIITYQFPFKGKKCEKNIHESFSQVFFLFCERAPFQLLKPAKLFQIITLCLSPMLVMENPDWMVSDCCSSTSSCCLVQWLPNLGLYICALRVAC